MGHPPEIAFTAHCPSSIAGSMLPDRGALAVARRTARLDPRPQERTGHCSPRPASPGATTARDRCAPPPRAAAQDAPRRRSGGSNSSSNDRGRPGRGSAATGFGRFLQRGAASMGAAAGAARVGPPFADDLDVSRLPANDTSCACGSGLAYGKCCRRFHTNTAAPAAAVDLLRARYAAYAYRLPAYIMRTTHRTTAELDRVKWRKDIMDFATEYRFCEGVEVVEQNMTSADTTTVLFRANMRRRTSPVSFLELSRFLRDNNQWYYVDGKLVDVDDEG